MANKRGSLEFLNLKLEFPTDSRLNEIRQAGTEQVFINLATPAGLVRKVELSHKQLEQLARKAVEILTSEHYNKT